MNNRGRNETDHEIGHRIRALRLERGLTQSELGRHVGVSFQQLQKYEKGMNRVSAGRLLKIATFLDAPITFFYEGTGQRVIKGGDQKIDFNYLASKGAVRLLRAYADISAPQVKGALLVLAKALRGTKRQGTR